MKVHTYLATQRLDTGTVAYMAPECFSTDQGVTEKSDVFSLGVLLWCVPSSHLLLAFVRQGTKCDM